jgi:flagellar FliL protein
VLVGVVIAALGIGGAVYYLSHTGRLSQQAAAPGKVETPAPLATHVIVIEPLLVNLADAGGNAYLRVSLAMRVADEAVKKNVKHADESAAVDAGGSGSVAAVRDTALMVLGRQTSDALLAVDGKEHLKAELKTALAVRNPDLKVVDVFFTDFLVQR